MSIAFESVQRNLDEHGVRYQVVPEQNVLLATFGGQHSSVQVAIHTDEHLLQVFAKPFFSVPEGARSQIAELCARMNYGLKLGKWEFDLRDGEIRYQSATCLNDDGDVSDRMIELVMASAMAALERYLPAILTCIYANEAPIDAVRHAESY